MAQGLLRVALDELRKHAESAPEADFALTGLACELGLFACVEEETLKDCFGFFAEDTPAKDARLALSRRPLSCACASCGASFELAEKNFVCPSCGSGKISFSGGAGITLTAISVEKRPKEN